MFDDVLSATALIGVLSVMAAAVASFGAPPNPESAAASAVNVAESPASANGAGRRTADAMPVYDLPRVVVTGQPVRDGAVLADSSTPGGRGSPDSPER